MTSIASITQRPLTPQQQDVITRAKQYRGPSILTEAVAGSGKTTLLVKLVSTIAGPEHPKVSVAFCAYNKAIAVEIEGKVRAAGVGNNVRCGTFHSFGFQAWQRACDKKLTVDDKKNKKLCEKFQVKEELQSFVCQLVSLAKQRSIGVLTSMEDRKAWLDTVYHFDLEQALSEGYTDTVREAREQDALINEGVDDAIRVLKAGISEARAVIDYDDMIYMPILQDVRMWQNHWVLIDEAQDTNPARRALAKKMLIPGGRLVAVGDRHQAIYGFTGADSDSMDLIKQQFGCVEMPLTVSFRCPKAVVAEAQRYVGHIQAHESAPQGHVLRTDEASFLNRLDGLPAGFVEGSAQEVAAIGPEDVVICRNTKPLVELAFNLIRRSIPCHIEGKDIGAGLMALATRWKSIKKLDALLVRLDKYLQKEVERMLAKGQEQKAESLTDRIETLKVVIGSLGGDATVNDLREKINSLFGDTPAGQQPDTLTLSTVHKAKGREWDRVFLWGANRYMPSPFARQEWQQQQETNLLYVAVTRAKQTLVHVNVPLPLPQTRRGR